MWALENHLQNHKMKKVGSIVKNNSQILLFHDHANKLDEIQTLVFIKR